MLPYQPQGFDPKYQQSPNTGVNGGNDPSPYDTSAPAPPPPVNPAQDAANQVANTAVATGPQNPAPANPWVPQANNAPPGFDGAKWADTSHTTPKYVAGRIMAAGGSIQDAAKAVGAKVISPDKIQYPDGTVVDMIFDVGGAGQHIQYTQEGPSGGGGGTSGGGIGGAGGTMSGLMGGLGGGNFGSGLNPSLNDRNNSLWSILMGRQGQGLNVNPRDPIIAGQTDAYRAELTRDSRNQLAQEAEHAGPYSNQAGERRMAGEKVAQQTGGLQASLMQNELTARRGEIQAALSQMGGMLSDDQKLALQDKLGMIDAALRQQGITNQNNQFLDQFGLNTAHESNYWDSLRKGLLG